MKPRRPTDSERDWRDALAAVGMSRVPGIPGALCETHAWCSKCGAHTRQVRRILAPPPGTRESSTELFCTLGKHLVPLEY